MRINDRKIQQDYTSFVKALKHDKRAILAGKPISSFQYKPWQKIYLEGGCYMEIFMNARKNWVAIQSNLTDQFFDEMESTKEFEFNDANVSQLKLLIRVKNLIDAVQMLYPKFDNILSRFKDMADPALEDWEKETIITISGDISAFKSQIMQLRERAANIDAELRKKFSSKEAKTALMEVQKEVLVQVNAKANVQGLLDKVSKLEQTEVSK